MMRAHLSVTLQVTPILLEERQGNPVAIYYMDVKIGNRAGGQSGRAKSEYIEREGRYAKDGEELEYRESGNMPEWAEDNPRAYWAAADEHERANGVLYRELGFALPRELDAEQRQDLARSFAQELTGPERLPYTMAIHRGDGENPHVHLMISDRGLDGHDRDAETWFKRYNAKELEKGGARKTRSMMSKEWLKNTREGWATAANRALERAGRDERIDHRTLAAQRDEAIERGELARAAELSRTPGVHLGPERHRAQRGGPSRVVEVAERIDQSNRADRADRDERSRQVERAAAGVLDLDQQARALDAAIRAAQRKAAWARIQTWALDRVLEATKWISEIPERRQERERAAMERRRLAEWDAARAARQEQDKREGAERMARWERELKEQEERKREEHQRRSGPRDKVIYEWKPPDGFVRPQETAQEKQEREARLNAIGRAAFVRSLDPSAAEAQPWTEREMGQEWKEQHWSEALKIEREAERSRPEPEHGPDRDYGPSR